MYTSHAVHQVHDANYHYHAYAYAYGLDHSLDANESDYVFVLWDAYVDNDTQHDNQIQYEEDNYFLPTIYGSTV